MMMKNLVQYIWETAYVILAAVILANYWIGFHLGPLSPLPMLSSLTYLMAPICGVFIYLFLKSVRKAFYATFFMCMLACFLIGLALFLPSHFGIVDKEIGFYISLRVAIMVFLYTFPFGVGGCMVAAYIYPD